MESWKKHIFSAEIRKQTPYSQPSKWKRICKVNFPLKLQNILGLVPYRTFGSKSEMNRNPYISIENLVQEIGPSLYTAAQN